MPRTELKLFRVKRGYSQEQMAARLDYSRNHYAKVESGTQEVTLKFLTNLSSKFGMSLEEAKELTMRDKDRKAQSDRETC